MAGRTLSLSTSVMSPPKSGLPEPWGSTGAAVELPAGVSVPRPAEPSSRAPPPGLRPMARPVLASFPQASLVHAPHHFASKHARGRRPTGPAGLRSWAGASRSSRPRRSAASLAPICSSRCRQLSRVCCMHARHGRSAPAGKGKEDPDFGFDPWEGVGGLSASAHPPLPAAPAVTAPDTFSQLDAMQADLSWAPQPFAPLSVPFAAALPPSTTQTVGARGRCRCSRPAVWRVKGRLCGLSAAVRARRADTATCARAVEAVRHAGAAVVSRRPLRHAICCQPRARRPPVLTFRSRPALRHSATLPLCSPGEARPPPRGRRCSNLCCMCWRACTATQASPQRPLGVLLSPPLCFFLGLHGTTLASKWNGPGK